MESGANLGVVEASESSNRETKFTGAPSLMMPKPAGDRDRAKPLAALGDIIAVSLDATLRLSVNKLLYDD